MAEKIIQLADRDEGLQLVLRRVLRMVPDNDRQDSNLQRLIAFRLKVDGEAATSEYLIRKIREVIKCAYRGSLYDFLKDDAESRSCSEPADPPETA